MGLDMYASRKAPVILINSKKSNDKLNKSVENTSSQEIAYWRKHNRLHGWMEQLWREKTGEEGVFNCEELELELIDITNLEKAILNDELPQTQGFFFGEDSYEDYEKYYKEGDLEFIKKARQAIMEGDDVVYNSWW
tara:strand:+ start:419 stop:826 length:408 start_codon:yes stop_codon:yes gene_type:complete